MYMSRAGYICLIEMNHSLAATATHNRLYNNIRVSNYKLLLFRYYSFPACSMLEISWIHEIVCCDGHCRC